MKKPLFLIFIIIGIIIFIICISYLFLQNKSKRVINIFKENFNDTKYKILDLGCGACCNSSILESMGYQVTALDVVDLSSCKKPQIYDGKKIPFQDKSFDIVLCSFVLHHADNWYDILQEMKRVGNHIIIIENTPEISLDYWFVKKHSNSEWGSCEECFKTNTEWLDIFNQMNFKVENIKRIPRWYFPFADKPYFYPVPSTVYILK
jgi:SAM-dependent methyltransferase